MICMRRFSFSLLVGVGTLLGASQSDGANYVPDAGADRPSASFAELLAHDDTPATMEIAQASWPAETNGAWSGQPSLRGQDGDWPGATSSWASWQDNMPDFGGRQAQWDGFDRTVRPRHGGGWEGGSSWGGFRGYDSFGTGPGCVVGAVPEPSSLAMGLLGLAAIAVFGVYAQARGRAGSAEKAI